MSQRVYRYGERLIDDIIIIQCHTTPPVTIIVRGLAQILVRVSARENALDNVWQVVI